MKNEYTTLINVILYLRVSSDEQAEGFSLNYQEESLKRFCVERGYNIIKIYREDHSAKDFKRPEWDELRRYAKANKNNIHKVLFSKWDRFSRHSEFGLSEIRLFDKIGIELNAVEQYVDLSIPDNKMMLAVYLASGEVERDKISSRTISGTYQAKREGYYASRAPFGYDSHRGGCKSMRGALKGKRAKLIPNDSAHLVTRAFQLVAMDLESIEATRNKLKPQGMTLGKNAFNAMLKNMVYAGKIEVPEFKKEPAMTVEGVHEPLIDMATFSKVQEIFGNKRWHGLKPSHKNLDFPLRDFLTCEVCGRQITGSFSKGRSKKYGYYHCREKCKTRVSMDQTNIYIAGLFVNMEINQNIKKLFVDILKDSESQISGNKSVHLKVKKERKNAIMAQLNTADDMRMANELPSDRYKSIVERYNSELMNINIEIEKLEYSNDSIKEYVDTGMELLTNLETMFMKSDYEGKRILVGSLFTGNLLFGNDGCRTTNVNEVINVLTISNKGLSKIKNGQTVNNYNLTAKVPEAGVEPARFPTGV